MIDKNWCHLAHTILAQASVDVFVYFSMRSSADSEGKFTFGWIQSLGDTWYVLVSQFEKKVVWETNTWIN